VFELVSVAVLSPESLLIVWWKGCAAWGMVRRLRPVCEHHWFHTKKGGRCYDAYPIYL